MTTLYGLAMGRGDILARLWHLIDAHDGQPIPWTARCGAICDWRSSTVEADIAICPECETRP